MSWRGRLNLAWCCAKRALGMGRLPVLKCSDATLRLGTAWAGARGTVREWRASGGSGGLAFSKHDFLFLEGFRTSADVDETRTWSDA